MNKAIVKIAQNFLIEIYDGKIKYLWEKFRSEKPGLEKLDLAKILVSER